MVRKLLLLEDSDIHLAFAPLFVCYFQTRSICSSKLTMLHARTVNVRLIPYERYSLKTLLSIVS